MMFDTISMIGLGYIGLPTATLFASRKRKVIGVDVSQYAVETINSGKIHIVEPELDMLVHAAVTEGYLRATLEPEPADAFLVAVPTPFTDTYEADLSYVQAAAKAFAPQLTRGNLVVLESTSPVGTTEKLANWLANLRPDLTFPQQAGDNADIQIAYCPERVLPGKVIHELVSNDRIIGGMTHRASRMAVELYSIFVEGQCLVSNARTAEMCKLTENSYRDVNIAFANELSMICDDLSIDVWELINLANHHPRVNILQPGAGVGGHCIAVDPWFIVSAAPAKARIIKAARQVNDYKPHWVLDKVGLAIERALQKQPTRRKSDIKIACLGLSFKPDIDDLRESPAVGIVNGLQKSSCRICVAEPHIEQLPQSLANFGIELMPLERAVSDADIVCILVKHRAFDNLSSLLRPDQTIIDAVGLIKKGV